MTIGLLRAQRRLHGTRARLPTPLWICKGVNIRGQCCSSQKQEKKKNRRAILMLKYVCVHKMLGKQRTTAVAIYYITFSKRRKIRYVCSVFFWLHLVYPTLISVVTVDFKAIHFP